MLNELNKHYNFNPKLPTVENNEKLKLEFTSIYLIKKDIDYNALNYHNLFYQNATSFACKKGYGLFTSIRFNLIDNPMV